MNWNNLITDIIDCGYGYTQIGRTIIPERTGASIRALHLGIQDDTAWHTGQQLIALHKKVMRKTNKGNKASA